MKKIHHYEYPDGFLWLSESRKPTHLARLISSNPKINGRSVLLRELKNYYCDYFTIKYRKSDGACLGGCFAVTHIDLNSIEQIEFLKPSFSHSRGL